MRSSASFPASLARIARFSRRVLRPHGWSILTGLSLLAAASMPVLTFASLWPLVSPMPKWDQWSMVAVWDAHYRGLPVLPLLLENYNGHWNCLPRILCFLLGRLSGWDLRIEVLLNYGAALMMQCFLLRMLYEARPRLLLLAAPLSAYAYSLVQYENFMSGYPSNQLMAQLGVTAAIYWLTRTPARPRDLAWAMAWATAALFSNSIAIGVGPVGLLVLLLLGSRSPWRWMGWTLVTDLDALLTFMKTAHVHLSPDWPRLAPFALTVLGNPFTLVPAPAVVTAQILGALSVVAFALLLAWRWRTAERALLARWGALGLFAGCAATLVAAGRSFAGPEQALSSHYVSHTTGLALAILVLAGDAFEKRMRRASDARARHRYGVLLGLLIAIVMAQNSYASYMHLGVLRGWAGIGSSLDQRLADGTISDAEIQRAYHPNASLVRWGVERLRQHHLAWFKRDRRAESARGRIDIAGGRPAADAASFHPGEPWSFQGWAIRSLDDGTPFTSVELQVGGLTVARSSEWHARPDVLEYFGKPAPRDCGWTLEFPGGALLSPGDYPIQVVARGSGGERAVIGELRVVVERIHSGGPPR